MAFTPDTLQRLHEALRPLLPRWSFGPRARHALIENSENATFRVEEDGRRATIRIGRPGYHDEDEVRSELAWITALSAAGVATVAPPLPALDGALAIPVDDRGHRAVAFRFLPGRAPEPGGNLPHWFERLGGVTARLHHHARHWPRPPGFRRPPWDFAAIAGPAARWGDWRAAAGLDAPGHAVLERAARRLHAETAALGQEPDNFGLVHCDLRLANLLVDGDRLAVIDFDDCGFCWLGYDFAAAVSFMEHDPAVPALRAAWLAGYRAVSPFPTAQERLLPAFVLLRRLQLTAWIASHAEASTARALGASYAAGTVHLAEEYLLTG